MWELVAVAARADGEGERVLAEGITLVDTHTIALCDGLSGTYDVDTKFASGMGNSDDLSAKDKRQVGEYMNALMRGPGAPIMHAPLDCASFSPSKSIRALFL